MDTVGHVPMRVPRLELHVRRSSKSGRREKSQDRNQMMHGWSRDAGEAPFHECSSM